MGYVGTGSYCYTCKREEEAKEEPAEVGYFGSKAYRE